MFSFGLGSRQKQSTHDFIEARHLAYIRRNVLPRWLDVTDRVRFFPFQSLRPGVQVYPWDGTGLQSYYCTIGNYDKLQVAVV